MYKYKASCEYKIKCKAPAVDSRPFPPCSAVTWGAGEAVERYGLVPGHRTALLAAPDGFAEVSFTRLAAVRLHASLLCEGVPSATLERCVSIGENDNQVLIGGHKKAR